MSCCADPRAGFSNQWGTLPDSIRAAITPEGTGGRLVLHVPDIHCAACISTIEGALAPCGGNARVNLTRKTVTLGWDAPTFDPSVPVGVLRNLGYTPQPLATTTEVRDRRGAELMRCVAVSGFAAMNVMLLSVSVWSGADGSTQQLFHWFSALIALPALAYAARPFFRSAFGALRHGRLNMDVPITLAIVLAAAHSLATTISGEGETYFDAAITLTFFLLIGRLLDHLTRERARLSVTRLAAMRPPFAHVVTASGVAPVAVEEIRPGSVIEVAAGERVPLDGRLLLGEAAFDTSLATGESHPETVAAGGEIMAGALAVTGPHRLTVLRPSADSYVSRLAALQAAAENVRSRHARIADRAAAVYAPTVHILALATFVGWLAAGAGPGAALTTAIAVLVITCPCALGLAVPAVHVAACERLFRQGLAIKDGAALERLERIDEVVFDKTGTLTVPSLAEPSTIAPRDLAAATALARHSTHPVSRAIVEAAEAQDLPRVIATDVTELRGRGMEGRIDGRRVFLGQGAPTWAETAGEGLVFVREGEAPLAIAVEERLRPGAETLVGDLKGRGLPVTILSGDRPEAVARVADELGVADWRAQLTPSDKVDHLAARQRAGANPLMVGDGLNDGPALAAATASIAPAGASDLSQTAADLVMTGTSLSGVWTALATARGAHRIVLQNLGVALAYNCIAVPIAVLGYASPLVAAIAMSSSSIVVTLNALRLVRGPREGRE
ncbi:heavy metal translocating P-type ATPase [Acuticoccus sediminis]|uniref:heavy metal translocating P-type ATPase n=1 Tax=Acuticoccus sediminis TaxID=2184697 RepID=UPI001CFF4CEE|nr:heavy metal translocating P-type ATPase [Acuticoccus sediminis]